MDRWFEWMAWIEMADETSLKRRKLVPTKLKGPQAQGCLWCCLRRALIPTPSITMQTNLESDTFVSALALDACNVNVWHSSFTTLDM